MEQSLDEYIASGKVGEFNKTNNNNKMNESKFKAERRQENDMEDDDDETFGMWRGPSSTKDYIDLDYMKDGFDDMYHDPDLKPAPIKQEENKQPNDGFGNDSGNGNRRFDLREKISGNIPHAQSNQWRLHKLNIDSNRPPGIPPLVPASAPLPMSVNRESQQNRQRWGNNKYQRNRNGGGRGGYGGNSGGDGGYNSFGFNNNNRNGYQNGRINRVNQRNDATDVINKNLRALLNQNNNNSGCRNSSSEVVQNLTVECINETKNSQSRHNQQMAYNRGHQQHGNVFSSSQQQNNCETNNLQVQHVNERNGHESIRSILGISDINTEMMPALAGKFLELLQYNTQITKHKPIYDMKIQKEIHQFQGKPLMYKCSGGGGGEIVSSDGAGINNCIVSPNTSGISLNNRFA